jgi:hypothetical protein
MFTKKKYMKMTQVILVLSIIIFIDHYFTKSKVENTSDCYFELKSTCNDDSGWLLTDFSDINSQLLMNDEQESVVEFNQFKTKFFFSFRKKNKIRERIKASLAIIFIYKHAFLISKSPIYLIDRSIII